MTESHFWLDLEYRVSRALERIPATRARGLWCDGIEAGDYHLTDPRPRITGLAWIVHGQKRWEEWRYTLLLSTRFESRDKIDWASLLPAEDETDWLSVNLSDCTIEIDTATERP